jgi:uncharacterized protein (TIGR00725 family)
MGGGVADATVTEQAYRLGGLIAEHGWVLLNGGRDCGVMDASARGAREAGGLVVGVLPDDDLERASEHLDIPILTGMGHGRNYVNVLSSRVVVALPGKAGTLSEVALALATRRPVVLLGMDGGGMLDDFRREGLLFDAATPEEAVALVERLLAADGDRGSTPTGDRG